MSLKLPKFEKWDGRIWSWKEDDKHSYANEYFFEAYCGYNWYLNVYLMKYILRVPDHYFIYANYSRDAIPSKKDLEMYFKKILEKVGQDILDDMDENFASDKDITDYVDDKDDNELDLKNPLRDHAIAYAEYIKYRKRMASKEEYRLFIDALHDLNDPFLSATFSAISSYEIQDGYLMILCWNKNYGFFEDVLEASRGSWFPILQKQFQRVEKVLLRFV